MLKPSRSTRILTTLLLVLVLLSSCRMRAGFSQSGPNVQEDFVTPTEMQLESVVIPTQGPAFTPTSTPVPASPTPPASIFIRAVKGNLFIRRGPDLAFDPVGVLNEGQQVAAIGRDILSKWAEIEVPGKPDQMGWVSLQTRFSVVDGELSLLPVIKPTVWPVAAYLRNCTYHQMVAEPGDIILPSLAEAPENLVWINPGSYTVYDLDHPDQPDVADVELREGLKIDIRVDGFGEKRKCPDQ